MPVFETSVTVDCEPRSAFEFLLRPANRVTLAPPDTNLSIVEAPDRLELGHRFEFEVRAYGQKQRFVYEIVELEPARRFVEQQIKGPFRSLRHEHLFAAADSGTQIEDRIAYEPPGGLLGMVLTAERIEKHFRKGVGHTHEELRRQLGQGTP